MNLNLMMIIVLVVALCAMVDGYKKGMVREIISFVTLLITCTVLVIIGNALNSYFEGEIFNAIIMILLLCVIGIVHHLLNVVFFSAKIIAKLPIVHWIDKLLGVVVGILETVLILWTIYTFIMLQDLGMLEQVIVDYTRESPILTWLYENNYVAYLVERVSSQITFLP